MIEGELSPLGMLSVPLCFPLSLSLGSVFSDIPLVLFRLGLLAPELGRGLGLLLSPWSLPFEELFPLRELAPLSLRSDFGLVLGREIVLITLFFSQADWNRSIANSSSFTVLSCVSCVSWLLTTAT